jgi:hypothetical protein
MDTFVIGEEHLKLARRMFVGWQDCETGAPEIDPKRPYGNSDVPGDIHELLTGEFVDGDEVVLNRAQKQEYLALHQTMETVLQIMLVHAGEAILAGDAFVKTERYNDTSWKRVDGGFAVQAERDGEQLIIDITAPSGTNVYEDIIVRVNGGLRT